jgi:Kef-type K+ transport system membrane component KefB
MGVEVHERHFAARYRRVLALSKPHEARYFARSMRWVASFIALGLMMALFHRFTGSGPVEARATVALGLLLVAATLGGDLARQLRLPRITGYVIVGFAAGPAWLGLVRADEIRALGFVTDAGVAALALAVGAALPIERLRGQRATLTRLGIAAILLPFAAVAAVTLSVAPWFPLTVHQPFGDAVAVALVLGAFAAASSSLVALTLIREAASPGGGGGAFSSTILAFAALQDVIALVLLAAALMTGWVLASPGALDLPVAGTALVRWVGSLAAGAVLAAVLAWSLRRFPRESLLLLLSAALVAAVIARQLHLEVLVIAVAAGFTLRNGFVTEGGQLQIGIDAAVPVAAVVVFAQAGAAVDLGTVSALWPWIMLLAAVRIATLRYGLRWAAGGRVPAVTPVMARAGWLTLIPQAGVALGVAGLARRAFPEWGVSLEGLVVAMIGVHLVAGPLCFRLGLRLAGELSEEGHVAEPVGAPGPAVTPDRSRL